MARKKAGERQRASTAKAEWRWAAALLLALLSVALYVNTLGHEFVFDDVTLILQNPDVINLDWWGILYESGYRPVRTLTYGLNYWIGGENPFGYHLFNVLLHVLNVLLVYGFVLLLASSQRVAVVAGLLFAAHPAQTAAVAYISGRKDLLAAFFILIGGALYLMIRRKLLSRWWMPAAFLAFLLAILSKEVAIVFPGLIFLVDLLIVKEGSESKSEETLPACAINVVKGSPVLYGLFLLAASGALYWALFINRASRMDAYWGGTFWTNLGTCFKLFVHYLHLVVFPYPLIADYTGAVFEVSSGLLAPMTLLAMAITLAYLLAAFYFFKKQPLLSLGMFWVGIALTPVLQLVPFHEIAADHFLYVPLVGASWFFAALVDHLYGWSRRNSLVWAGLGLVILLMSILVIDRNGDWQNKRTLWTATLEKAPDSFRANTNLGLIYMQEGRLVEGVRMTRHSIELNPSEALPYANLGAVYYSLGQQARQKGNLEEAESLQRLAMGELEKAIQLESGDPFKLSNLGNAFREMGNIHERRRNSGAARQARQRAEELYEEALRIPDARKEVQNIWFNYGGLMLDQENYREAIEKYNRYLHAFPESKTAHYWLGFARLQLGLYEEAVPNLRIAAEERGSVELWEMIAAAASRAGAVERSLEAYQELKRLSPNEPRYRIGLSEAYLNSGRNEEAAEELRESIGLGALRAYPAEVQRLLQRFGTLGVRVTEARPE